MSYHNGDFSGCSFERITFSNCRIDDCTLTDCSISYSEVTGSNLLGSDVKGSQVTHCWVDNGDLRGGFFAHSQISHSDCNGPKMNNCVLEKCVLMGVAPQQCTMKKCVTREQPPPPPPPMKFLMDSFVCAREATKDETRSDSVPMSISSSPDQGIAGKRNANIDLTLPVKPLSILGETGVDGRPIHRYTHTCPATPAFTNTADLGSPFLIDLTSEPDESPVESRFSQVAGDLASRISRM